MASDGQNLKEYIKKYNKDINFNDRGVGNTYIGNYDRPITMEDLEKDTSLASEVKSNLIYQRWIAKLTFDKKHELFNYWEQKLTDPARSKTDTIKVNMVLQHLKKFLSNYYSDEMQMSATGVEFLDDDWAYMVETLAKHQYKDMNKKQKDFFNLTNVGLYGVGIEAESGWDRITKCIKYDVISPKFWMADPMGNIYDGYQYHIFPMMITKQQMLSVNTSQKRPVYFNVDKIWKGYNAEMGSGYAATDSARNISTIPRRMNSIDILYFYTNIGNYRYKVGLGNNMTTICQLERLTPVTEAEKENPLLVPYPVNITQVMPLFGDPCGIGLCELVLDFQNAKNKLLNLALIKEERNAGYKQFIVDINKISNLNYMQQKNPNGPTFIPARGDINGLGQPVIPVGDDRVDGNTLQVADKLDFEAQMQTGFSNTNRGMPTTGQETLGELQMQRTASDALFQLDSQVISWGLIGFWKNLWFRGIQKYLPAAQKITKRISNGLAYVDREFKRDEILMNDPDIYMEPLSAKKQRYKQLQMTYMQREPVIMNDPSVPQICKTLYKRAIDKFSMVPREEIYTYNPLTKDELRARRYKGMIDDNVRPKNLFKEGMDLYTYYIYFGSCKESPLKDEIMMELESKMEEQGLMGMQEGGTSEVMNALQSSNASQMTSQMMSQNAQQQ